jgi:hypothetical protein
LQSPPSQFTLCCHIVSLVSSEMRLQDSILKRSTYTSGAKGSTSGGYRTSAGKQIFLWVFDWMKYPPKLPVFSSFSLFPCFAQIPWYFVTISHYHVNLEVLYKTMIHWFFLCSIVVLWHFSQFIQHFLVSLFLHAVLNEQ